MYAVVNMIWFINVFVSSLLLDGVFLTFVDQVLLISSSVVTEAPKGNSLWPFIFGVQRVKILFG